MIDCCEDYTFTLSDSDGYRKSDTTQHPFPVIHFLSYGNQVEVGMGFCVKTRKWRYQVEDSYSSSGKSDGSLDQGSGNRGEGGDSENILKVEPKDLPIAWMWEWEKKGD